MVMNRFVLANVGQHIWMWFVGWSLIWEWKSMLWTPLFYRVYGAVIRIAHLRVNIFGLLVNW